MDELILKRSVGSEVIARVPPSQALTTRARKATAVALQWGSAKIVLGVDDGKPVEVVVGDPAPDPIMLRVARATHAWKLSPRQAEVLSQLVIGRANKEIAQTLKTAKNTVELHITTLFRKTGVASRTQLIAQFWAFDAS